MYRTHHCNELRKSDVGENVTLVGWVNTVRDQGGVIFVDIRDREGVTQCVFRPEENADAAKISHSLRSEDVIQVTGRVDDRPEFDGITTVNEKIDTGEFKTPFLSHGDSVAIEMFNANGDSLFGRIEQRVVPMN